MPYILMLTQHKIKQNYKKKSETIMKFPLFIPIHMPNCLFILWCILIAPHLIWVPTASQDFFHHNGRRFECSQMETHWISSVFPSFVTIQLTVLASVLLTVVFLSCKMLDDKSSSIFAKTPNSPKTRGFF
jgi:hypothetical protein